MGLGLSQSSPEGDKHFILSGLQEQLRHSGRNKLPAQVSYRTFLYIAFSVLQYKELS
jgi:hypothetical protein